MSSQSKEAACGNAAKYLRNIDYSTVVRLAELVDYQPGQVTSRTFAQNSAVGVTLFAMPKGEGISAHKSTGDAFLTVLEGQCTVTIDASEYALSAGDCIVMPAGHPHAVTARENFKMFLVVVFPE